MSLHWLFLFVERDIYNGFKAKINYFLFPSSFYSKIINITIMDANDARRLAHKNSPLTRCIESIDECIRKAAASGKYKVTISTNEKFDEKTIAAIKRFYTKKGFVVTCQIATDSNGSTFHIDWSTHTQKKRSLPLRWKEILAAGLVSYPR